MTNIDNTTKFSRLKSISRIQDYSFNLVIYLFSNVSLHLQRKTLLWRKCLMKLSLNKSEFLKGFFNLFVFGFLCTIKKKSHDLWRWRKYSLVIEIRLCNLMTYAFKGHVKIVKIYLVKFNVSVLNKLQIMVFCKYKVNT